MFWIWLCKTHFVVLELVLPFVPNIQDIFENIPVYSRYQVIFGFYCLGVLLLVIILILMIHHGVNDVFWIYYMD